MPLFCSIYVVALMLVLKEMEFCAIIFPIYTQIHIQTFTHRHMQSSEEDMRTL